MFIGLKNRDKYLYQQNALLTKMTLPDRNDVYPHRLFHWSDHNSPSREAQDEERETPVRKQHHLVASINTHTPCLPCYFTSNLALLGLGRALEIDDFLP